jgi:hypothetical protein
MSRLWATALGAALLASAAPASAWETNGLVWPADLVPITIDLHDADIEEMTVGELEAEVIAAIEEWNAVGCAEQVLQYTGRTDARNQIDAQQVYVWVDDPEEWGNMGSMVAGATLITIAGPPTPAVDILYNAVDFEWRVGGGSRTQVSILDPRSVITHETGHLLGLSHTRDDPVATMAAAYLPDLGLRTLGRDDKIGLCELFWSGGSECSDDSDCRERERCEQYTSEDRGETVTICSEIRGTYGDPCSVDDLNCIDICLFTRGDFSEGYCTSLCEEEEDCPDSWFCHNFGTPSNPYKACRFQANTGNDEDGEDVASEDTGGDVPGEDAGQDLSEPDGASDLNAGMDTGGDADAPPPDPGSGEDPCGCHTPAAPLRSPWLPLLGVGFAILWMGSRSRRFREGLAVLVLAPAALAPTQAQAQDMNFEEGEAETTVHVVLTESTGIARRAAETVIFDIEDRVGAVSGFRVVSKRSVKRSLGRVFRQFKACDADVQCNLDFAELIPVDRMIFVRIVLEEGLYNVDMELRDDGDTDGRPYATAITADLRDASYLDEAVAELLAPSGDNDLSLTRVDPGLPAPVDLIPPGTGDSAWLNRDNAWYAIGGGTILGATGGIFALLADTTLAEIQATTHSRAEVDDLIATGESHQLAANVFILTGLVAIVGGTVLYLLTDEPVSEGAALGVAPSKNGAAVEIRW